MEEIEEASGSHFKLTKQDPEKHRACRQKNGSHDKVAGEAGKNGSSVRSPRGKTRKASRFSKGHGAKNEVPEAKSTGSSDASDDPLDNDSDDVSTDSDSSAEEHPTESPKKSKTRGQKSSKSSKKKLAKGRSKTRSGKRKETQGRTSKATRTVSSESESDSTTDAIANNKIKANRKLSELNDVASRNLEDRMQLLESYLSQMATQRPPDSVAPAGLNPLIQPRFPPPPPPALRPPRGLPPGPPRRASGRALNDNADGANGDGDLPTRPDFKRVDWVWDTSQYCYKLQDTVEAVAESQYEGYVFHVRRTFDHEGKYLKTFVDIKSKLLRECLQDVIKDVQGISLVDEIPKLDPNLLYLYFEDLRTHHRALRDLEPAGESRKVRKKNQRRLNDKRKHLRVLLKYLDQDYSDIRNSLEPMLHSGLITYDLLWALWKPGTLVYTPTYGNTETPRVFKVDTADRHRNMIKGDFYYIDGKYIEYDGKRFGYGSHGLEIAEFRGARRITSLPCYPLQYCKDESKMRKELIERGKKFVALSGVHFKAYTGMAFMKRKKSVLKFNLSNSRIMVDPAIFRRINPNYYVSHVKPKNHDVLTMSMDSSEEESEACCGCNSSDSESGNSDDAGDSPKFVTKICADDEGKVRVLRVSKEDSSDGENQEALGELHVTDNNEKESVEQQPAIAGESVAVGEQEDDSKPSTSRSEGGAALQDAPGAQEAYNTPESTPPPTEEGLDQQPVKVEPPLFTDDEYIIASPLVLGFSFAEKQWLEFDVALVNDIKWNENAWESLVLDHETKDLIQALVESRKYNAATKVDDVIQGKGKGLVTVLHGPPGTGKTLTAEGISELLQCPLYMASAGELGTDSRFLEHELQKILDICHAWGAILLLDEADVFLEKRNMQDIHRNALVSIFLRQLEYFQGILFLTTNRVETFDEAFQSRIHIALRYDKLDIKAKRAIFKLFIERVREHGKLEVKHFSEDDLTALSKHDLNGREIKNVMGSAQDLAVNKGEALSMRHIKLVLDVHAKFGRDLKGGTGFEDAMRSYF